GALLAIDCVVIWTVAPLWVPITVSEPDRGWVAAGEPVMGPARAGVRPSRQAQAAASAALAWRIMGAPLGGVSRRVGLVEIGRGEAREVQTGEFGGDVRFFEEAARVG